MWGKLLNLKGEYVNVSVYIRKFDITIYYFCKSKSNLNFVNCVENFNKHNLWLCHSNVFFVLCFSILICVKYWYQIMWMINWLTFIEIDNIVILLESLILSYIIYTVTHNCTFIEITFRYISKDESDIIICVYQNLALRLHLWFLESYIYDGNDKIGEKYKKVVNT